MMIFEQREKIYLNVCRRQTYHCAKRNITAIGNITRPKDEYHCNKDRQSFVATSHAPQITERRLPTFCASPMT